MNSLSTRRLFRSCTTSLSSRTLARSSLPHRQVVASQLFRRSYSEGPADQTAEKKDGTKEPPASNEEKVSNIDSEKLAEQLKVKDGEVVDLKGRLRYLQADFLNLQRNSAREKEQTRDYAISRFVTDLLETVDVLSLALKSIPPSVLSPSDTSSSSSSSSSSFPAQEKTPTDYLQELHHGVEMTQRQLLQTLFKYHVKPFDPTGDRFDPNRHEALYQAPIPGKEPGTVVDCQKLGYTIKDRVLRAAQVGVAQETQS